MRRIAFSGLHSNIRQEYRILVREAGADPETQTHCWCSVQHMEVESPELLVVHTKVKGSETMRIARAERDRVIVRKWIKVEKI